MKKNKSRLVLLLGLVILLISNISIFVYANDVYQTVSLDRADSFATATPLKDGETYYLSYPNYATIKKWHTTFTLDENSYAAISFSAKNLCSAVIYDENYCSVLNIAPDTSYAKAFPFKTGKYYLVLDNRSDINNSVVLNLTLVKNVFSEKEPNDTFSNANYLPLNQKCLVFVDAYKNRDDYFYFETDGTNKHIIWIDDYEEAQPYLYLYESDRSSYSIISLKYNSDLSSYYYEFVPKYEGVYYIKASGYNDATSYSITIKSEHQHNFKPSLTTESSCVENTTITYICSCGLNYIEDVPATGHNYIETINKATLSNDGEKIYKCKNCSDLYSETISKISSVKLSSTKVAYNGKTRTPSIVVTDANGNELVKDIDYTVTYDSGRKLPGIYNINVKFIGNYQDSKSLKFTITPKATTGVKATEKTGTSITLSWTKTIGATGYRVYQYSSSKGEYVLKKSVKTTKYKVTGLKKNTSYKFKIRPYKKTEDGTVIWGSYSNVFTAKTTQGYGVDISGTAATLATGKSKQLKATTTPAGKSISWKSSKKSVATVSSTGKVTAKAPGTATITATFEYKGVTYKDTYKITVKSYIGAEKTSVSMKDTESKKVLIKTDNTLESITYNVIEGSSIVDCTWGEWDNGNIYLTIKPLRVGKAKIKVHDTYDEDNFIYINVTVKVTPSNNVSGYGDITGNVTYFYNNYRGDVSDTGSKVILIPMDGRALDLKLDKSEYYNWWSYPSSDKWSNKYGIYGTEVDGKGEYYLSDVPAGRYILFVISKETTCGEWFDDEKAYAQSVVDCVEGYLSKSAAKGLGETVSMHKYYFTTVTIKNNSTTHKSVDFGYTYI